MANNLFNHFSSGGKNSFMGNPNIHLDDDFGSMGGRRVDLEDDFDFTTSNHRSRAAQPGRSQREAGHYVVQAGSYQQESLPTPVEWPSQHFTNTHLRAVQPYANHYTAQDLNLYQHPSKASDIGHNCRGEASNSQDISNNFSTSRGLGTQQQTFPGAQTGSNAQAHHRQSLAAAGAQSLAAPIPARMLQPPTVDNHQYPMPQQTTNGYVYPNGVQPSDSPYDNLDTMIMPQNQFPGFNSQQAYAATQDSPYGVPRNRNIMMASQAPGFKFTSRPATRSTSNTSYPTLKPKAAARPQSSESDFYSNLGAPPVPIAPSDSAYGTPFNPASPSADDGSIQTPVQSTPVYSYEPNQTLNSAQAHRDFIAAQKIATCTAIVPKDSSLANVELMFDDYVEDIYLAIMAEPDEDPPFSLSVPEEVQPWYLGGQDKAWAEVQSMMEDPEFRRLVHSKVWLMVDNALNISRHGVPEDVLVEAQKGVRQTKEVPRCELDIKNIDLRLADIKTVFQSNKLVTKDFLLDKNLDELVMNPRLALQVKVVYATNNARRAKKADEQRRELEALGGAGVEKPKSGKRKMVEEAEEVDGGEENGLSELEEAALGGNARGKKRAAPKKKPSKRTKKAAK